MWYNNNMTSNIYRVGNVLYKRSAKQGRKLKPVEIKKVYKMTMVTPQAKKIIEEKARKMNMSYSAYVELAGVLFSI